MYVGEKVIFPAANPSKLEAAGWPPHQSIISAQCSPNRAFYFTYPYVCRSSLAEYVQKVDEQLAFPFPRLDSIPDCGGRRRRRPDSKALAIVKALVNRDAAMPRS